APEAAPHAALGPPLEEHAPVIAQRHHHEHAAPAAGAREARSRQLVLPPGAPRDALLRERAAAAEGLPPHAHRRAEIHDRLGVLIDPVVRGEALRELPKPPRHGALRRVARHAEVAREHPPRVAIEDRKTLSARERENRPGGRAADTGERGERVEALGELPAVLVKDVQRRAMEVAGARVVAEPGPEVQHLIHRGRGERAHIREALHEAPVIGHDGRDLGLLQHDFRHPDAIRGAVLLPGKIVSSFAGVPLEECGGDRRGAAGQPLVVPASRSPAPCSRRTSPLTELTCNRAGWPWPLSLTSPLMVLTSRSPANSAVMSPLTALRRCSPSTPEVVTSALTAETSTSLSFGTLTRSSASPWCPACGSTTLTTVRPCSEVTSTRSTPSSSSPRT